MYKTKLGLKLMDRLSTKDDNKMIPVYGITTGVIGIVLIILGLIFHSIILGGLGFSLILIGLVIGISLNWLGYFGTGIGFLGMIFILYVLIKGVINLIISPVTIPTVTPLLPGIQLAPGIPVLSFWHWIIGILIIACIHEFSHGLYARLNKVPLKSSGFAFIGPLLAAFVEPNEKVMSKKRKRKQMHILVAGPLSNIITGILFFTIGTLVLTPIVSSGLEFQGLTVVSLTNNSTLNTTNITGETIIAIDGVALKNSTAIESILLSKNPGDTVNLRTLNNGYNVSLSQSESNSSKASLGIYASAYYGHIPPGVKVGFWFIELFFWLYVISLGVGLFNLLPLGPVDGGRMFYVASLAIFKKERNAKKVYKIMTWICIILILINLLPFILNFLSYLFSLF